MTVMIGLENGETTALRTALENGEIEERTARFITEVVLKQSVGWQIHSRAACAIMRCCAKTLRKIKATVAELPGFRLVTFRSHVGQTYTGLLFGDYVENEGFDVVSWIDADGVVHDGVPPTNTSHFSLPTSTADAFEPVPDQPVTPKPEARKPKMAEGWKRYEGEARTVVEQTTARSVSGVAKIIRWGVETAGRDIEDVVARLVRLGQDVGVTRRTLEIDLEQTTASTATHGERGEDVSRETPTASTASDEEITEHDLRRSCEVSEALRPIVEARPELAPGAGIMEALAEDRRVLVGWIQAERWTEHVRGDVGDFTRAEGYDAMKAVLRDGREATPENVARKIRATRIH